MNSIRGERGHRPGRLASSLAFWTITLMHDNPLLPFLKDPYRQLSEAGLEPGQKVLEVGCGPGFFTIPAAKIVGEDGIVYALDVNPLTIERVQKKIKKDGIKNVRPLCKNGSDTGLPDSSIDLAFIFGTLHFYGGLEGVISETHRILKTNGTLSFERTRGSEAELRGLIESAGFRYSGGRGRIFTFKKE
ncbi:MAG: class I SAM-dependent methyltransferase [Deltaproteobacteria bacterium]|uniref:Class I SAM-dependent methyltransferase n=1 Tax=Candidatus Zymogenus saltonus TaxID=2844893 RepID=A0A9D8KFS1_9DELT|nr:class I SAM-dependent methyltransferase [Candidatus Zymogenus saltonus]